MTTAIIITFCTLILLAYLFDISGKKTRIPGVVLLLTLGVGIRWASDTFGLRIPNLQPMLPVLGTLGLILIVLEGSLDLGITREKFPMIRQTFISAVALFTVCSLFFAQCFILIFEVTFLKALVNAIPLGIISSAIAISSIYHLEGQKREFVIYESTFSDIIGILFFNFFTENETITTGSAGGFIGQLILITIISVAASFALGVLLERISHHIKAIPIITLLILIYMIAKFLNLPSLLLILVFGLVLRNIGLLQYEWLYRYVHPETIARELVPFKQLVGELTFVIRSFFFIMFGYYTDIPSLINPESLAISLGVTGFILLSRYAYMSLFAKQQLNPILYIAPRGLITILLFLTIPSYYHIKGIGDGLLTQVIYLTSFIMMIGLMNYKKKSPSEIKAAKEAPLATSA